MILGKVSVNRTDLDHNQSGLATFCGEAEFWKKKDIIFVR